MTRRDLLTTLAALPPLTWLPRCADLREPPSTLRFYDYGPDAPLCLAFPVLLTRVEPAPTMLLVEGLVATCWPHTGPDNGSSDGRWRVLIARSAGAAAAVTWLRHAMTFPKTLTLSLPLPGATEVTLRLDHAALVRSGRYTTQSDLAVLCDLELSVPWLALRTVADTPTRPRDHLPYAA